MCGVELNAFENAQFPQMSVPVPDETVALLRIPMWVGGLSQIVDGLKALYGPDLLILTDVGLNGWMVIARSNTLDIPENRS